MEPAPPHDPEAASRRRTAPPWTLLREALGGPQEIVGKLGRVARTARLWLNPRELNRRLAVLERKGFAPARPTRLQLLFGGLDMLRFMIEPAAREYYRQQRISFGFHQCLRILDDPVSMIDPTGLLSERDTIMGHVMQVVHLNPLFDLQLLEAFPGGLEQFERELEAMVAGSHPRARTIAAVKSLFGFCQRMRYVSANAAAELPLPRYENRLAERVLSKGDVQRLLSGEAPLRDRMLLSRLYFGGLHVSEACKPGGEICTFAVMPDKSACTERTPGAAMRRERRGSIPNPADCREKNRPVWSLVLPIRRRRMWPGLSNRAS